MIDSHCHLDLAAFDDDIATVIRRSEHTGVSRFLIPGTTPSGWQRQRQLQQQYEHIDLAFGLHPYFDTSMQPDALSALTHCLQQHHQSIVAVGEIGLDATVSTPLKVQQDILAQQLELATEYQLPVILHHRKSHHLLQQALKQHNFSYGGIIHAFSGSQQVAESYIERGFLLGVGGTITYPRASKTRQALSAVALENMVLETDAPDMPVAGYQGQRNTPERLPLIAEALSTLLKTSQEQVVRQTTANYQRLFFG
ncbi:TatD family hydrolase [Salinimonas marina]|uniref:TatD family hydrolase n=1 Tax=Salinimonas marina TaxID=2785918 RepID=A0A7S9DZ28_9ALTE|nr:TatD family hydrolase [Salinimonas marina]QPG06581.1 TatD family hydrolase [Salinimonas marina]